VLVGNYPEFTAGNPAKHHVSSNSGKARKAIAATKLRLLRNTVQYIIKDIIGLTATPEGASIYLARANKLAIKYVQSYQTLRVNVPV
jgi:hypothetical protein